MKKIVLTLGAMLALGIASAQTDPKQAQQKEPVPTQAESMDKAKKDAEVQNDVTKDKADKPKPRKDELKTRDHVKSTPDPDRVKDTTATTRKTNKKKKA